LLPEISAAEAAAAAAAGDPTAAISRQVLEDCHAILSASQTADGEPLTIIRVPEAGAIEIELTPADGMYLTLSDMNAHPSIPLVGADAFVNGDNVRFILAASYMNFVVTNQVVLIPKFHLPDRSPALEEKDEAFRAIIAAHYPGRSVVQVNVDALTVGGGGMHCITQQIPA
jgi:agmatine deiminase